MQWEDAKNGVPENWQLWAKTLFDMEGEWLEFDAGETVCACFGVGMNTLRKAILEQGLVSVAAIGAALKAGTNCGSCIPELKKLIQAKK